MTPVWTLPMPVVWATQKVDRTPGGIRGIQTSKDASSRDLLTGSE